MLRNLVLILVSAGSAMAQFGEIRWKCDAKDGRFIKSFNNGPKFYCWDGKIFSNQKGYDPVPQYVLDYWEEVHRKSEERKAEIVRKTQEMQEKSREAQAENARLNQERAEKDRQFNEDLRRKIAQQQNGTPQTVPTRSGPPRTASTQVVAPKTVVLAGVSAPDTPEAAIPPVKRAKTDEVQVGMDRAQVEGILGKPHGSMSIPEDDGLVEVLNYTLDDRATAKVRIEKGKVVTVKIVE